MPEHDNFDAVTFNDSEKRNTFSESPSTVLQSGIHSHVIDSFFSPFLPES